MSKEAISTERALKLALEALDVLLTEPIAHKAADRAEYLLLQAAPAIRKALAEQQKQEPVAWGWAIMHSDGTHAWIRPRIADFFGSIQEREPYTSEDAKHADREWAGLAPHTIVTLYTSAPASKPWVGLTGDEWQAIVEDDSIDTIGAIKIAIEAKLKEKNT